MSGASETESTGWTVAVASSDGVTIDSHLGQTNDVWVYALERNGTHRQLERRSGKKGQRIDPHAPASFAALLAGVDIVLAAQVGPGAVKALAEHGLRAFSAPGRIARALEGLARRGWILGTGARPEDFAGADAGAGGGGCGSGAGGCSGCS
jgi:nitrogen fixation protein NifB